MQKHEIVDCDPETGLVRTTYGYPSEPPSTAIPLALAELTGDGETDLDPLYDAASLDPDALDEFFRPTASGTHPEASVTFTYHDYTITVKGYGRILIQPPETRRRKPPD